jgi:acetyltransferase-like isoleucine patch superfamily enzyme
VSEFVEIPKNESSSEILYLRLKASYLGRFYLKHIKKRPLLRATAYLGWKQIYPVVQRLMVKKRTNWKMLKSINEYVSKENLNGYQLIKSCQFDISIKQVLPAGFEHLGSNTSTQQSFPSLSVYQLKDAKIRGGSNLVDLGETLIHHNLSDYDTDYTSEELHARLIIKPRLKKAKWLELDEIPERISEAAVFLDATSHNYAHWLTEVLPRLAAFCEDKNFSSVPLVIDSGLHPNIIETLRLLGPNRTIYLLPRDREVIVSKLFYTTACGYVPFQPRRKKFRSHGRFSPLALNRLKIQFSEAMKKSLSHTPKKIYLKRNSSQRNIVNAWDLECILKEYGYTTVEPEKLSFQEQHLLFSNAESIISASGAALANCIFCAPGTEITVLISDHKEMIYRYWSNMLSPVGINVNYIIGNSVYVDISNIHSDFKVEPSNLEKNLEAQGYRKRQAPQIHPTANVSPFADIGENVSIGPNTIIHPNVVLGNNSCIEAFCELGVATQLGDKSPLNIGEGAIIRSHSVFYESSSIGSDLVTGHNVIVRENTVVGCNVQIGTNTEIQGDCKIGNYVRFQSSVFVGKKTTINDFVWILPYVVFTNDPTPPSASLLGAYVEEFACISAGSLILPGIKIGKSSLVAAASCVTKDVPPGKVVAGNPAKVIKDATEVMLRDGSCRPAYPWTSHFGRGYPEHIIRQWKENN